MPHYFLLLDGGDYQARIVPALAASWRERSFGPCRALADWLRPALEAARSSFFTGTEEPLLVAIAGGVPFERRAWRRLVGEVLRVAAREVPEIETAPEALRCLLAPDTAIDQAHFGSRSLVFGSAIYRPDHAGLNDRADVERLAAYLGGVE